MGRDHGHPYILSTTVLSDQKGHVGIYCLLTSPLASEEQLSSREPRGNVECGKNTTMVSSSRIEIGNRAENGKNIATASRKNPSAKRQLLPLHTFNYHAVIT